MKVLVIAVHPDDETLGCGGTILKHRANGDEVSWLIVTSATAEAGFPPAFIERRAGEIGRVAAAYGFAETVQLGFPATRLHAVDLAGLITAIGEVVRGIEPATVYTVNRSDIHTDHEVAARAVLSATKSFRNPFVKRVLMYECLSETEIMPPLPETVFLPQVYSDVSAYLDRKVEIMGMYGSENQSLPLPRNPETIRALARVRGAAAGVGAAEAFMLLRDVF